MKTRTPPTLDDVNAAKEAACQLVEHFFGKKPRRLTHQSAGLSNFVFLVSHAEGEYVVRISPDPTRLHIFVKEQWATEKAREYDVPAPRILEVGNEIVPFPYMISERTEGEEATRHPERLTILYSLGRLAARINQVRTQGFGGTFDWSSNELSRNETWSGFLTKELELESRLKLLAKHHMLEPARLKKLRASLEALENSPSPALNHGDLRLKNVLVNEEGKITALIDWERCLSSIAPHWDLSVALHDLGIDEKQKFLDGYGVPLKDLLEMAPALKALNIINYASHLEEAIQAGDTAGLEHFRVRLSGALDLYSI